MEKARRDKRKEVQTRLNFREKPQENPKRKGELLKLKGRKLAYKIPPWDIPDTRTKYRDRSRDEDRFCSVKRWRESESPSSESNTSNEGHWKSRTKRCNMVDEDDLAVPWTCAANPQLQKFAEDAHALQWAVRVWFDELPPESINGYKGLKAAFLAYFMQQKKYVKDPVEIHNIKQRDGETIEDFKERFKVETGRMKGAPKCMWISGFMHGVNNPELTKHLNEHVPKTMEEIMTVTTTFIRG
ncbi:reverse transcriptase domain-containing protein [Tanacetum coccineum]